MPPSTPATRVLNQIGVPYRLFMHTQTPKSLAQAALERGQTPGQVIRSILFKVHKDNFFLTLMAGPERISWRSLRAYLGISRISLASREEVQAVTGFEVGTVSPLGLARHVRILADESVFEPEEISIGSGIRGIAIILKSADLKGVLGEIEVGQFC
jgi:Cys-tRNA(Pro)/Cys-tRNA(Cys) deacylase